MNKTDKKILEYLTEKDKVSESGVINETFRNFDITKEKYRSQLRVLQNKDLIRYEQPLGNSPFVYITENGRYKIKPLFQKALEYMRSHFVEILILLLTFLILFITILSFKN